MTELTKYQDDFYENGEGNDARAWYEFIVDKYKEDLEQIITLAFNQLGRIEFAEFLELVTLDTFEDYQRNFSADGIIKAFAIDHESSQWILDRALANYPYSEYLANKEEAELEESQEEMNEEHGRDYDKDRV